MHLPQLGHELSVEPLAKRRLSHTAELVDPPKPILIAVFPIGLQQLIAELA